MEIAFLVAAHTDAKQLFRLTWPLLEMGDVFIHIDKKNKNPYFFKILDKIALLKRNKNEVFILKNRISVAWAGYSQIKCQYLLFEQALNSHKKYNRFFYLSGLDYPIFSSNEFDFFLNKYPKTEFVSGYNLTQSTDKKQLEKICLYHFFRDIPLNHKSILRRAIIGCTKLFLKYIGIRRKPYLIINNIKWNIYFGSQWICVTRECAKLIMEQLQHNKKLEKFFKTTYAPDELCIPTIVFNSTFSKNALYCQNMDFKELARLHYLNYTTHIWTYDEKDYNTIINSKKPFVRKLVSGKSEKLIRLLEKRKKAIL